MSTRSGALGPDLPYVDERLIAAESRFEVVDGKVEYVAPADEPHASRHSKVSALVEAHAANGYDVASDMLTRTSRVDDFAPDVSVFPTDRDAETGSRKLEELAFEIVSSERLSAAGRKAAKLTDRGVRRVFAVDVERVRVFEWSRELSGWSMLREGTSIEDCAFAVALPVEALVRAAKADDAMARALLGKRNAVLMQALDDSKMEGQVEGTRAAIFSVLDTRGLQLNDEQRQLILRAESSAELDRWLRIAVTCSEAEELFERAD